MSQVARNVVVTFIFFLSFARATVFAQVRDSSVLSQAVLDFLLVQYADSNNISAVGVLLRHGADANAASFDSITSLMCAVQNHNYFMACLLLGYNANPAARTLDGTTALHIAAMHGTDSIAMLLVNHKAELNARDKLGLIPLHYSVWYGYPYLTSLLVEAGSSVDAADIDGNTPLILAVYNGANACAQILLEHGADPNLGDCDGITPLMVAAQYDDTLQLNYLLKLGADPLQCDVHGFDALGHAVQADAVNAASLLLQRGFYSAKPTENVVTLPVSTQNVAMDDLLKRYGMKAKPKLQIESLNVGIQAVTGKHLSLWGLNLGLNERLTKISLNVHYMSTLFLGTTLVNRNGQLYQFKEKRQSLGFVVSRSEQLLKLNLRKTLGAYYGIGAEVLFRNFKGAHEIPANKLYFNAKAGMYIRGKYSEFRVGWNYTSLRTIDTSPHCVEIGLNFRIPIAKHKIIVKQIDHV